ncbi:putative phosphatidate phosphatase [Daktulosphaira vitifoliae]|uniref:putative phosphatidate phosphatase n=1 Tax=Daktulosphaira vitifoliae TaxID=58002 RepID=UPI0021A991C9|nr:putative phosphatidate phosphatase [Daktulosphaira vitifoliae]XP_050520172.1 putative phosphatidate phosphatase [Daktulosphaira vitifoliae]XP_050520173.1 putative phosphatidate phosphatase [Daktulosphaira vitifoliae]XP_050520174.1 putative phosphatidate phosphatase [Daktulosphaira vitifoliae]
MDRDSKNFVQKIAVDIVCLGSVGFSVLIFYLSGEPYQRGFYCNDESIRYPFRESTVPSSVLYSVGLGLPTLVILTVEYLLQKSEQAQYSLFGKNIPNWVFSAYNNLLWFLFGAACSQLTTDVGKYTIGRLRPHFLDVCGLSKICTEPGNQFRYIEDISCENSDDHRKKDSRLSFPSGHSSLSFYCMVYLAVYLQSRIKIAKYGMAKSFFQFIVILMAAYCALTRVSNYKHHWSDVLAGTLLGSLIATLTAFYVSDLFISKTKCSRKRNNSSDNVDTINPSQTVELKAIT